MTDYTRELAFAKNLAKKAGSVMTKYFRDYKEQKETLKSDQTPLTIADTTINMIVIEAVRKEFPEHGVLGEEGSFSTDKELLWVCDPIDGTFSFTQGIPVSVFSIALCYKGEPRVAVIYNPFLQTMYSAVKEYGSYLNNKKLPYLPKQNPKNAMQSIGIEIWVDESGASSVLTQYDSFGKFFCEVEKIGVWFNVFNSAVYNSMLVAEGRASAVVYSGVAPWDAAACKLILAEVGATTVDIFGEDQTYNKDINGFIGVAPYFVSELEHIIASSGLRDNK